MFFGAKGAVGWFQLQVEVTVQKFQDKTMVYVDNVFIKSSGELMEELVESHAALVSVVIDTFT